MKQRLVALSFVLLLALLVLSSCGVSHWEFSQDVSNVRSIQVLTNDFKVVRDVDISKAQEIYDEVTKLEYRRYFPSLDESRSTCGYMLLITFSNGTSDLIAEREPESNGIIQGQPDKLYFNGYISFLWCEEESFTKFIKHYIEFDYLTKSTD